MTDPDHSIGGSVVPRAALLKESGRAGAALALLAPHLAANPEDLAGLRLAGWCHLELDEPDRAFGYATRLCRLAPEQPAAHLLLAVVQGRRHDPGDSVRAVDRAIALAPYSSEPYRIAAALDLQAHRASPRTEQLARRAVELAPHDPVAHRVLGSTLIELRRLDEAAVELGQAASLDPANAAIANELARIDIARGRSASAAAGFADAVRADPSDLVARHNLQAAAWNAFRISHLVLLGSVLALAYFTEKPGRPNTDLAGVVAPICVLLTLGAWAFQFRSGGRGIKVLVTAIRSDPMLSVAMIAHLLCIATLAIAPVASTALRAVLLYLVLTFLATSTIVGWLRLAQIRKESQLRP